MIQRILLRLPEEHWQKLMAYHFAEKKRYEALSFLWGYTSVIQKTPLICVPHNVERLLLAPDCFETQSGGHLRLRKSVQVGITMEFARSTYNTLINIHDHADILMPSFSGTDDNDDLRQDENIRNHLEPLLRKDPDFVPRHVFNASLVLARNGVDGRLTDVRMRQSPFLPIDEIQVIGTTFQRIETTSCRANNSSKNRDERSIRHRDFIQLQQQDVLSDFKVAVVGAGGIGSILAEGLLRSGVGDVTIIDHDDVSESNLNRWQSGRPCDLGKPKATTLAARLRIMFPTARIRAINRQLYTPAVERVLARSDAIMGAVDNAPARYFMNRLCVQYMVPYFDAGVAIQGGDTVDFMTRIYAVVAGTTACTECIPHYELLDKTQVTNAYMDSRTVKERQQAGYVVNDAEVTAPSAYALNLRAVSSLLTEFLNWICAWRPLAAVVYEQWRSGKYERTDRKNFATRPAPDCPLCSYYSGLGSLEPLPRPRSYRSA